MLELANPSIIDVGIDLELATIQEQTNSKNHGMQMGRQMLASYHNCYPCHMHEAWINNKGNEIFDMLDFQKKRKQQLNHT